jgi:hypothetical protein
MKSKLQEKVIRSLLSLICFMAYTFLFIAVLADALNTNVYRVVLG